MPPIRSVNGRASKACEACRRTKTRCYNSDAHSSACLRCHTLNLHCSLREVSNDKSVSAEAVGVGHDCAAIEARVTSLEQAVHQLNHAANFRGYPRTAQEHDVGASHSSVLGIRPQNDNNAFDSGAPLDVIRNVASESPIVTEPTITSANVIEKGFLTADDAQHLLRIFKAHYIRWINLREDHAANVLSSIRRSPLLLCACCLIAVRHSTFPLAPETAALLYIEVKSLLSECLLHTSQPLEFFQAVLLLSLWSTTVGQKPLSIDSWLISGFAIQQAFATDTFSLQLDSGGPLLWTRLCLSHLHACVSVRRSSMLRQHDVDQIMKTVSLDELSNFETRMVAELSLYWTIYNAAVAGPLNLPKAQAALQAWKAEWLFLFQQSRSQFLRISFHFAQLLMYERSLIDKSAAVRESLLYEMVRLCTAVLRLAMESSDDRTKHLTDHIYHVITFSAVTLCRLSSKYKTQMNMQPVVTDTDTLIIDTAQWLGTLGSTLHVGHVMSDVIIAVHRKSRPDAHETLLPNVEPTHPTPDDTALPSLLAVDWDWDQTFSDWQSLPSNHLANSDMSLE